MLLTEEELNARLNSDRNLANRFGSVKKQRVTEITNVDDATKVVKTELNFYIPLDKSADFNAPVTEISGVEAEVIQEIDHREIGRAGRDPEVPNLSAEDVNNIATLSAIGIGQGKIAAEFGISQAAVSYIDNKHKKVNRKSISVDLERAKDLALEKLLSSLNNITEDKLANADALKLSSIASNMSKVMDNTRDKSQDQVKDGIQIIVFTPEMRQESTYKTIEV